MIEQIIDYDNVKVRESLASDLLACAIGNNDTLDAKDVKGIILEMDKVDTSKSVRFFIEAGLEYV